MPESEMTDATSKPATPKKVADVPAKDWLASTRTRAACDAEGNLAGQQRCIGTGSFTGIAAAKGKARRGVPSSAFLHPCFFSRAFDRRSSDRVRPELIGPNILTATSSRMVLQVA